MPRLLELLPTGQRPHFTVRLQRADDSERLHEYVTGGRWTGRAAVLWADGAPAEIAFWGYSGDLKPGLPFGDGGAR